jgi:alpha-glucosidase
MVQNNIDQYAAANIPLEGIWLDIEYMDGYADFTVNTTAFPTIKDFSDRLH